MADQLRLSGLDIRDLAYWFVQRELGVTRDELLSHRRQAYLVEGRALFVWIVKSFGPADLSYPRIARWLGGRDHSTIQHLYKNKAPALRERNADFATLCDRFAAGFEHLQETYYGHTRH